jgi:hypothetical protein
MAGNSIFRGPVSDSRQPRTVNKPVATALLPGTFVEETATQLTVLTTAVAELPMILGNQDYYNQDIAQAYVAGDTGVAYHLEPGQVYQVRMAAATYTLNQPLTIGAAGRATAAVATSIVVAFYSDVPGAVAADGLRDVIIANSYTAA